MTTGNMRFSALPLSGGYFLMAVPTAMRKPSLNLYDFSQMELAHEQQLEGRTCGKIVVSIK
ncbi:hypothetical protein [Chitinophaga sp. LS1]|uniref:hypothetical protein n=1 Tax=Chitinophaga sp. LS1 TaxID=3051176 RepID=UPI002AAAED9D|nr:hypothetical protein [Chitinophaga sp. LS1]WPV69308.1 hypothetical protein QQL36_11310 [Chitinophaga sp. LS1]